MRLVRRGRPRPHPANVTIPNDGPAPLDDGAGIGDSATDHLSTEASWNRNTAAKAQATVDAILGPGKATVTVTAA